MNKQQMYDNSVLLSTMERAVHKSFPGSELAPNLSGVGQFNIQRAPIAFGDSVRTHQTDGHQKAPADFDDYVSNQSAGFDEMLNRVHNPELQALRGQNPFLSIVSFPLKSLLVVGSQNNDVRDVQLPNGTQMVRFTAGRNVDFFVSANGAITMPPVDDLTGNGPLLNPTYQWYYVKGLLSLSVGIALAGAGVTIQCYVQL